MKLTVEVLNLPKGDMNKDAELLQELRQAVIDTLQRNGHRFGSGYSVWGFYDDD